MKAPKPGQAAPANNPPTTMPGRKDSGGGAPPGPNTTKLTGPVRRSRANG